MAHMQGLVAFAETVRQGSFASAARELGLTPSAVAKSVARLEADLGLRLLHRTTRQVSLTSDGRDLFDRCRRIVDELDALRADAEGVRGEPSGTLRLNAPITYGRKVLVPQLARLVARYPRIALDVTFSDRLADLAKEGFDAAVRVGHLRDSTLVARPIARQRLVVCASPDYLASAGRPLGPARLPATDASCSACRRPAVPGRGNSSRTGESHTLVPRSAVTMNDGEALVATAVAGFGARAGARPHGRRRPARRSAGRSAEVVPPATAPHRARLSVEPAGHAAAAGARRYPDEMRVDEMRVRLSSVPTFRVCSLVRF